MIPFQRALPFSFNLDSIAQWGKFPHFCVKTYKWGDQFFNGYDSVYVAGTGYKFNIKTTTASWFDTYNFQFPEGKTVIMRSYPTTSIGAYLTYLAVSIGYDINISKIFTGENYTRQHFRFGFNCSLFSFDAFLIKNNSGTIIKRMGNNNVDIPLRDIKNTVWSIGAYYFFNHKRYSEAAAFNYSRVQKRSQGSFYIGCSINSQLANFNFNTLADEYKTQLSSSWDEMQYNCNIVNYTVRVGYGYNWVFAPKWILGISESPDIGLRTGNVNNTNNQYSISLYNHLNISLIWNNGKWFAGIVGRIEGGIHFDKSAIYANGIAHGEACIGYRFNLW